MVLVVRLKIVHMPHCVKYMKDIQRVWSHVATFFIKSQTHILLCMGSMCLVVFQK